MHESAPNIAECFRCSLFDYEWWGILQVTLKLQPISVAKLLISVTDPHLYGAICEWTGI